MVDLESVAARAALAGERVTAGRTGDGEPSERQAAFLTSDAAARFGASMGLDDETLRAHAVADRWPDAELPAWTTTVESVLDWLALSRTVAVRRVDGTLCPFAGLFGRIVAGAVERLPDGPETTRTDLGRILLDRLVQLCGKSFHADYLTYVAQHADTREPSAVVSSDSTAYREAYREAFLTGRKTTVFERYPVLARQVALVVDDWTTAAGELLDRVAARGLGAVGVTAVGDSHDRGRCVCRIDGTDNTVYKPRPVDTEAAVSAFRRWLSGLDGHPELPAMTVTDCDTHGWVEPVEPVEKASNDELASYYTAAGATAFLHYLLVSADAHHENVVATADGPVLVDTETVLHRPTGGPAVVRENVLYAHLFPFAVGRDENDGAGFEMTTGETTTTRPVWRQPGTDAVEATYDTQSYASESNLPKRNGQFVTPAGYLDAVLAGFRRAYDAVRSNREAVADRLRDLFAGVRTRRVLFDTDRYAAALATLSNPTYLRDGFRFGCKARAAVRADDRPAAVGDAEVTALLHRDVPSFVVESTERAVRPGAGGEPVTTTATPGLTAALARLDSLSVADRDEQLQLVRAAVERTAHGTTDPHGGEYG